MKKGFLITFEGGEGCGKTTQIKKFEEYLKAKNIDYILSKEPGGTVAGEEIRQLLLHTKGDISPMCELFLLSAARTEHIEKVVKPALDAGKVVVLDRFYHSTFAYQGYAGNISLDDIKKITDLAVKDIRPNLVFLLDMPPEVGFLRKSRDENLKHLDRFENKGNEYHERVRNGYLKLAQKDKSIKVIDATLTPDEVSKNIVEEFEKVY